MILDKALTNTEDVLHKVLDSLVKQESLLLTYFNHHCFNIYYDDETYRTVIRNDFEIYQADLGIYLALRFFFGRKINRIIGTDLNETLLKELINRNISITIIGGNFDENFIREKSIKKGINLVRYQNGFFNEEQSGNIIDKLSSLSNQVFIIGMGVPKQEFFAKRLSRKSGTKLIICVGNFLEFYFGTKKRAPVFLRKIGFEWLFRLFTEPARLWKRYLLGIPLFLYHIIKLKITSGQKK
jgi:exopolysaccharide biosynthesis WecB/TagA/CpsF family protein